MSEVEPRPMRLADLKKAVDAAVEYAGDTDPGVEVWIGDCMHRIIGARQFSIIPTMTLKLGPVEMDLTSGTGKPL